MLCNDLCTPVWRNRVKVVPIFVIRQSLSRGESIQHVHTFRLFPVYSTQIFPSSDRSVITTWKGEEREEINKIEARKSQKISSRRSFYCCFDALKDNLVRFQGMQTRGRGKLVE